MFQKGRAQVGRPCLVFLLVCVCALAASAAAAQVCYQAKLSESAHWLSSATWVNGQMALVDPLANRVMLVSAKGQVSSLPSTAFGQPRNDFFPAELERTRDGWALSMVDGGTLFLDEDLGVRKKAAIASTTLPGGAGLRTLYQWTVADNMLVGFGSVGVKGQPKNYRLGIVRAPLAAPERAQLLLPFGNGDAYVLGHDYFTNLGPKAYFMLASTPATLYEISGTGALRKLNDFPPAFRLPEFKTKMTGPKAAEALFAEIETYVMPVGLYGYKDMLYLLVRRPENGATKWLLYQINPKTGRIMGDPIRLPTSTEHLAIVTSPDRWFLIQRGKVLPLGQQKIETFVSVPASWITSERSPLRGAQEPPTCQMLTK